MLLRTTLFQISCIEEVQNSILFISTEHTRNYIQQVTHICDETINMKIEKRNVRVVFLFSSKGFVSFFLLQLWFRLFVPYQIKFYLDFPLDLI